MKNPSKPGLGSLILFASLALHARLLGATEQVYSCGANISAQVLVAPRIVLMLRLIPRVGQSKYIPSLLIKRGDNPNPHTSPASQESRPRDLRRNNGEYKMPVACQRYESQTLRHPSAPIKQRRDDTRPT